MYLQEGFYGLVQGYFQESGSVPVDGIVGFLWSLLVCCFCMWVCLVYVDVCLSVCLVASVFNQQLGPLAQCHSIRDNPPPKRPWGFLALFWFGGKSSPHLPGQPPQLLRAIRQIVICINKCVRETPGTAPAIVPDWHSGPLWWGSGSLHF